MGRRAGAERQCDDVQGEAEGLDLLSEPAQEIDVPFQPRLGRIRADVEHVKLGHELQVDVVVRLVLGSDVQCSAFSLVGLAPSGPGARPCAPTGPLLVPCEMRFRCARPQA